MGIAGTGLFALGAVVSAIAAPAPAPTPKPFVPAILQAYKTHDLVALGESGSPVEHALIGKLVADPRFSRQVRSIVVEFGSGRYQALADRYLFGGPVSLRELSKVWELTTQRPGVWGSPVYARLFINVRALNKKLPQARRVRIILGDPPIDWQEIHPCAARPGIWRDPRCIDYWYQRRDSYFASRVQKLVLAHGGKALLLEDPGHFWRTPTSVKHPDLNTVTLLEGRKRGSVFVVSPYMPFVESQPRAQRLIESWPFGSVAKIAGTSIGAVPARALFGPPPRSTPQQPRVADPRSSGTLADLFDALLRAN